MKTSKSRVAILGATGLVGQQFVRLLNDHPFFEPVLLTGSSRSVGKKYNKAAIWLLKSDIPTSARDQVVMDTSLDNIVHHDVDIAFVALPTKLAGKLEQNLANEGVGVFTNASCRRMDDDVPILVPEINSDHSKIIEQQNFANDGFIVTNSNCSTAGVAFGLKPLEHRGLRSVYVTTYQALSGAGRSGLESMKDGSTVIPYIKGEEKKIEIESRKILGEYSALNGITPSDFYINASCARVPVENGHLISIIAELKYDLTEDEAKNIFTDYKGGVEDLNLPCSLKKPINVVENEDGPQPCSIFHGVDSSRTKGMVVHVGRIRKKKDRLNFYLLVHNTIRGAAGASILNAEYFRAKGLV